MVALGARLARVSSTLRPLDCGRAAYVFSLVPLLAAAGLGVHAAYSFFSLSLRRLRYPFDLEWMEGGMLGHVSRGLDG